jgi:hypothetical protein
MMQTNTEGRKEDARLPKGPRNSCESLVRYKKKKEEMKSSKKGEERKRGLFYVIVPAYFWEELNYQTLQ